MEIEKARDVIKGYGSAMKSEYSTSFADDAEFDQEVAGALAEIDALEAEHEALIELYMDDVKVSRSTVMAAIAAKLGKS